MEFSCELRALRPSTTLAVIKGSLDAGTSIEVENEMTKYLGKPEMRNCILDLAQLTFISSSGLRILMIIIKALAPRSGKLFLVGAGEQVVNLVNMSGMSKMLFFRSRLADCEAE